MYLSWISAANQMEIDHRYVDIDHWWQQKQWINQCPQWMFFCFFFSFHCHKQIFAIDVGCLMDCDLLMKRRKKVRDTEELNEEEKNVEGIEKREKKRPEWERGQEWERQTAY